MLKMYVQVFFPKSKSTTIVKEESFMKNKKAGDIVNIFYGNKSFEAVIIQKNRKLTIYNMYNLKNCFFFFLLTYITFLPSNWKNKFLNHNFYLTKLHFFFAIINVSKIKNCIKCFTLQEI